MVRRRRLGWLGPAIVAVGVAVAALGAYAVVTGRPEVGEVIDQIDLGEGQTIIVRAEAKGDRNFVELVQGSRITWRAMVPPYAGRRGAPGIAWGQGAITVRVIREGRAEIFALTMATASKLGGFKLAPGKGAVVKQTSGPVTLTDHTRSYELVGGAGWHQLVAIDLATGEGLWKQDLAADAIEDAALEDGAIWVLQGGIRRVFDTRDGSEKPPLRSSKPS
jgi:outer membrane protein assembly factor BamB